MVVEVIYVVRHGFRSNWVVDASTGTYTSNFPTPTGIPSDPSLASHGVEQAQELATHLCSLTPAVDAIHSSPFYRCLQTLTPTLTSLNESRTTSRKQPLTITPDPGLGEFYGLARFDHPSPASHSILETHFPNQLTPSSSFKPAIVPSVSGESISQIHDRVAYALHAIIAKADADPNGPKALLLCTHAAVMICIGRALTGRMPDDFAEDDFRCATCCFSKFVRRRASTEKPSFETWDAEKADQVPDVGWREGKGVMGGWDCEVNGDCSFLSKGEERGWRFSGDESFLKDPNAFNDPKNEAAKDGQGTVVKGNKL